MDKKLLQELNSRLEKEKKNLEEQLQTLAEKDKKLPGDWDTKYPRLNGGVGSSALEEEADEVEEYATRLPIEYALETKLRDINLALKKIKGGKYGICDNCHKPISQERLNISPETRFCRKCKK